MSEHDTPDADDVLDVQPETLKDLDPQGEGDDVRGGRPPTTSESCL